MTLTIGLIGGGPWAHQVHAPGITAHPDTTLAGVWARRPEVAAAMTGAHGGTRYDTVEALIADVDAVAFAVPPAVQAEYAIAAARAGRHLILEKPIAADLPAAERLADAVTEAGVAALVMLTRRFAPETRRWLAEVHRHDDWQGATATWLSGALLGGDFADSPWRHDGGALLDIGPHTLDLADAALGTITGVPAIRRGADDFWQLLVTHEGGRTSAVTLSLRVPIEGSAALHITAIGPAGALPLTGEETSAPDSYRVLLDELTAMIAAGETDHPCDVRRGLHLQRLLTMATDALDNESQQTSDV